jgi:hypothetical protein
MGAALPQPFEALGGLGQQQVDFVLHAADQGPFELRTPQPGQGRAPVDAGQEFAAGDGNQPTGLQGLNGVLRRPAQGERRKRAHHFAGVHKADADFLARRGVKDAQGAVVRKVEVLLGLAGRNQKVIARHTQLFGPTGHEVRHFGGG